MENYGKIDQKTGMHTRLLDFARSFDFCINYAIENNVDFFLFSGDAYKTAHPSPTQQKLLLQALLRLYKAGIPTVIIVGNHDNPLTFGKAHSLDIFGNLPLDGFHVVAKPSIISLMTKSGQVNIVGIPWPTRNSLSIDNRYIHTSAADITQHISRAVTQIIAQKADQLDRSIPAVLAGHLTVSSGVFSGSEKRAIYGTDPLFLTSQLAIEPFDYVALGHLHRYQNLNSHGYPAVVYSGSIDRIDFGERKEDKGFCVVTIAKKGHTSHEFIKIATRPFIQIEVKLTTTSNQTEQVVRAISGQPISDAVIKVIYYVPEGIRDLVDVKKVQQACEPAMYVVGIIPINNVQVRERRAGAVKTSMDLPSLLSAYFDTKPELKEKKAVLIKKALLLAQEEQNKDE